MCYSTINIVYFIQHLPSDKATRAISGHFVFVLFRLNQPVCTRSSLDH